MEWMFLAGAILFEVAGTISMKLSEGFSRIGPTVWMILFYVVSFIGLTIAIKKIDLGVAYAIWSGVGTALAVVAGVVLFREIMTPMKFASVVLIVIGVIGLNLDKTTA